LNTGVGLYYDEHVFLSVCGSVCPPAYRPSISETTRPDFDRLLFVHVAYGRGSVIIWRRCDTLRASGFVDDIYGAMSLTLK